MIALRVFVALAVTALGLGWLLVTASVAIYWPSWLVKIPAAIIAGSGWGVFCLAIVAAWKWVP